MQVKVGEGGGKIKISHIPYIMNSGYLTLKGNQCKQDFLSFK